MFSRPSRAVVLLAAATVAAATLTACSSSGGGADKSSSPSRSVSASAGGPSAPSTGGSGGSGGSGATAAPTSAGATAKFGYYLSLGDSLAFGYQQGRYDALNAAGTYSPAKFASGYSDLVLAALKKTDPKIVSSNLGCPGETTGSYLKGGCPFKKPLHTRYSGSQDKAALAFLAQHSAHSGPGLVTVSLGANDLNTTIESCGGLNITCILPKLTPVFAAARKNLTSIITQVHKAAPQAKIVVLELYDPYAVDTATADLAAQQLNTQIAAAAKAGGATTVNAFPVFNPATSEKATLCRLTEYCTKIKDIHPTDAGYRALAALFLHGAGVAQ